MRSGATFSANQAVPDLMPMPTLRRLQHHIMSSQTAPRDGTRIHTESTQPLLLRSSQVLSVKMSALYGKLQGAVQHEIQQSSQHIDYVWA